MESKIVTVTMPYGNVDVDVNNANQVLNFVKNACKNCHLSNVMSSCSGVMAEKCNSQKDFIVRSFLSNK